MRAMADDLRKLKDEAAHAAEKGKHRKAAELYARIAEREHDDAQWPQKAGEALRRAGAPSEALPHLARAAELYARNGFSLKAMAMAKVMLQIDPRSAQAQRLLAQVASQPARPSVAERVAPAPAPPLVEDALPSGGIGIVALDEVGGAPPELPLMHAPLATLPLAEVVEGAHPTGDFPIIAFEIPVEPVEEELELHVEAEPPPLPKIPLFSSLPAEQLRALVEKCRFIDRAPGQAVVREGEAGDALYVIVRGEFEVTVAVRAEPIGRLGEGAFFGELAVLTNRPRSATVTAISDAQLLEIDRAVLASLVESDPAVLRTLLRFFRDRLTERLFATSPLFAGLAADEARSLAEGFHFLELEPGSVLVEEAQRASGLFVILCGECDVTRGGSPLAELAAGDVCGELSLMTGRAAAATVRARSRVWALALARVGFQELISTHPQVLIYVNEVAEQRRAATEHLSVV